MNTILQQGLICWQNGELEKALELFEKGAVLEDPSCLYLAGFFLQDGLAGGRFDRARAFDYIEKAAALGQVDAIYCLGYFYVVGGMSNLRYSDAVLAQKRIARDEPKGFALIERAAEQGHATAIFRMARHHYSKSKDDPQHLRTALEWYAKGIAKEEAGCLVDMADMLVLGVVVNEDLGRAKLLYEQASHSEANICAKNAAIQRLADFGSLKTILSDDR